MVARLARCGLGLGAIEAQRFLVGETSARYPSGWSARLAQCGLGLVAIEAQRLLMRQQENMDAQYSFSTTKRTPLFSGTGQFVSAGKSCVRFSCSVVNAVHEVLILSCSLFDNHTRLLDSYV